MYYFLVFAALFACVMHQFHPCHTKMNNTRLFVFLISTLKGARQVNFSDVHLIETTFCCSK